MKLLIFTENEKVLKSVKDVIDSSRHETDVLNSTQLSSKMDFSEYDAIIVDKKTWQRNASILKYFNSLDAIKDKPMLVLTPELKLSRLKHKEIKQNVQQAALPVKPEDFTNALESLINVGAEV